ncbi:MAG: DUF5685 family protein [Lachnospiraceae bacterium]|nr:DUF5685 family protein [Lachnospiraceae bacterium]
MFGYVTVNPGELKVREYELYKSFYCGVCRELAAHGQLSRLMLSYDMTFLAMLENALYELPETVRDKRCLVHPVKPHKETTDEATAYAADMTILLGYQKAMDDWRDERKPHALALGLTQQREYRKLQKRYPRQARAIEEAIGALHRAEEENCRDLDYVSGLTGRFLGEMFNWKDDLWGETLREMGFFLGKFIYIMDAFEDCRRDEKKGSYNVLLEWKRQDEAGFAQRVETVLTDIMSQCAVRFERLPIVKNASILRNVLYAGVWVTYSTLREQEK